MAVQKVVKHPNEILRKKTRQLTLDDLHSSETKKLIRDMRETMFNQNGIGIAANQIGVDLNLALVRTEPEPTVLVNPKIIQRSWKKETMEEGCLSIPGVFGTMKRSYSIEVENTTLSGEKKRLKASGLFARVIQHEIDHLNGKLFIDGADKITRGTIPQ